MAFDLESYVKKQEAEAKFDLDSYVAKHESGKGGNKANLGRMAQTAIESYGNTALLGNLPHLQAAVGGLVPDPGQELDEKLLKDGFTISTPQEGYIERRDQNIKRQSNMSSENPGSSMIGTLAGIAGGAALGGGASRLGKALGFGLAPPASVGGRVGRAAGIGIGLGALTNPGDVEGEAGRLQLNERAKNALIGGALGGAAQGAAELLKGGGKAVSDYFRGKAGEKASAAIGATTKDQKRFGDAAMSKLGNEALEEGLVGPLTTPASVLKKVKGLKEEAGETIGNLIAGADAKGAQKIDTARIGVELLDDAEVIAAAKTPGSEAMFSAATKQAETLAQNGELTLTQAHQLRRNIDKSINFNKRRTDLKPGEMEVLYKIRDKLNSSMNEAINGLGEGADALKNANARYSKLSQIEMMADKRVAMNAGNRTVSLTDTIAGAAGMAQGGPTLAAALAGANKLGRTFGKGVQATGFNLASNGAARVPAIGSAIADNQGTAQALLAAITDRAGGGANFQPSSFNDVLENPKLMENFKKNPSLINAVADPMLRSAIKKRVNVVRKPSGKEDSAFERRLKAR